jgi:hypothetical protein
MSLTFPLEGGCHCGEVRYQVAEMPIATAICHCVSCRRIAGADRVAWAVNNDNAFAVTKGEPCVYASSECVERTFCSDCGTTLTYRNSPDSIDVTLASLDDPEALPPTKEVWCQNHLSWNPLNTELEHHDQGSA